MESSVKQFHAQKSGTEIRLSRPALEKSKNIGGQNLSRPISETNSP